MLEKILKLYVMAMRTGVTSPLPHLFGPPGCGKSTVVKAAADLLGVNMHTVNVSRISPLELEGVMMPHTTDESGMYLKLLTATFWTQLREGDILLLDEFLRGFPEVYNGLLDILTAREVGGYRLPRVFIIGASNSTVSYDKALEDRLLHLPVPDPRKSKPAKKMLADMLVDQLGLMPEMKTSMEIQSLLDSEVLPMYEILDQLGSKTASPAQVKGCSLRNLIGQAQLREVHSAALKELLDMNNRKALSTSKVQFTFLTTGVKADPTLWPKLLKLVGNDRLTEVQKENLELNLQLLELEEERLKKGTDDDDNFVDEVDESDLLA
jgi:ATPase family associated with various cellular activities (AAA)